MPILIVLTIPASQLTKVNEVKLDNLIKYVKKQVGCTPDEGVYIAM